MDPHAREFVKMAIIQDRSLEQATLSRSLARPLLQHSSHLHAAIRRTLEAAARLRCRLPVGIVIIGAANALLGCDAFKVAGRDLTHVVLGVALMFVGILMNAALPIPPRAAATEDELDRLPSLDCYELAYLAAGKLRLLDVAIIKLATRGAIRIDPRGVELLDAGYPCESAWEECLVDTLRHQRKPWLCPSVLESELTKPSRALLNRLAQAGLHSTSRRYNVAFVASLVVSIAYTTIMWPDFLIGIDLLILGAAVAHWFAPQPTARGQALLEREERAALVVPFDSITLDASQLAAIAVLGTAGLVNTSLKGIFEVLEDWDRRRPNNG